MMMMMMMIGQVLFSSVLFCLCNVIVVRIVSRCAWNQGEAIFWVFYIRQQAAVYSEGGKLIFGRSDRIGSIVHVYHV